jgi:uncharacterized Zn finger protein (UPF0148 family)
MDSRFSGEAASPPLWAWCSYCGAPIHIGHAYYRHMGDVICIVCARRYAWSLFEADAVRRVAHSDGVLP